MYEKTDIIAEVSTEKNRLLLWDLHNKINLKIYAQKIGWLPISKIEDLPTSHRQGSIFMSKQNKWID